MKHLPLFAIILLFFYSCEDSSSSEAQKNKIIPQEISTPKEVKPVEKSSHRL